jgi:TM2 domain-containing membrane protein YozV
MVNAILAALMSLIIPGTGQIVSGEVKKGIIFLAIEIILYILFLTVSPSIVIISFLFAIYAAYDAYNVAKSDPHTSAV